MATGDHHDHGTTRRTNGAAARPIAVVLALVTLAGCNGDDDAVTTTTAEPAVTVTSIADPTTTTPAPTTVAPTTAPPTTVPPTTTEPAPTTPTTEPGTSSTVEEDPRFAVIEAVEQAWVVAIEALRDPTNEAKVAALDDYYTGQLLEGFTNIINGYVANNQREVENPDVTESIDVDPKSLAVNDRGDFTLAQACEITAAFIVEIGGNPDGTDRIVDELAGRGVIEYEVVLEDGQWKLSSARRPEPDEQIASCGG